MRNPPEIKVGKMVNVDMVTNVIYITDDIFLIKQSALTMLVVNDVVGTKHLVTDIG